uniref:Uncharacterized protein n=1 Tax=Anguilla anguilla TaxID=7936 RepID=A0A0E9PAT6_ANGAN
MRRYGTRTLSRVLRGSERVRVCVFVLKLHAGSLTISAG